jgi:hypothetical protein
MGGRWVAFLAVTGILAVGAACSEPPSSPPPSSPPPSTQPASVPSERGSEIRRTDWRNATVKGLEFCAESDEVVEFRNGSNGFDIPCVILPGGAQPVYAHVVNEEPASRPSTIDALVLVELGNLYAARQQALVPIQLDVDGKTLLAWPPILGDEPSPAGDRVMTFTSYRVEPAAHVVATVRRLDGGTETRRYAHDGSDGSWRRL